MVPACPVEAIYFDEDLPQEQIEFLAINERLAQTSPIIFAAKDPHPQAEEYRGNGKRFLLEPAQHLFSSYRFRSYLVFSLHYRRLIRCIFTIALMTLCVFCGTKNFVGIV